MTSPMTTTIRRLIVSLALLILLTLLPSVRAQQGSLPFAHTSFAALWERTDSLVASGAVRRSWFWGPQPNTGALSEEYREGSAGRRLVQYYDKSRMEVNDPGADPSSPFFVTNGLLTVELISGRAQTGDNSFTQRQPSRTNVTGDYGDPLSLSYAQLAAVSSAGRERRDPDRTGRAATATLSKEGRVGDDPSKGATPGVRLAYYEPTTGHNVPQAMWDFLNSSGSVSVGGRRQEGRLSDPWFYASGLPISDPYWVRATIAGKSTDVLVQAYERRVLTYVPSNPEGFRVEMGNVGQHYYEWRYGGEGTPPPATHVPPTPSPTSQPALATLSRYSIDIISDASPATLDMVKGAGAGAVRLYVSWRALEPANVAPAQYNWAAYDGRFRAIAERGLQPIAVVVDCPTWACSRDAGPIRVERVGDFAEFMGALAGRYGKAPYNAHHWEFWNEPDSTSTGEIKYNWGTYGARYAAMLGAVRPAMKAADPGAQLVMGGVAYDNFQENGGPFVRRFVDDVLDAGGGRHLDAFNFHYYVQNIYWCSFTAKLNELRGKLQARNLTLPIITTETGFTSDPEHGSSLDTQSLYVAQAYAQSAGEGVRSTTWFIIKDFTDNVPGWEIFYRSGLLDRAGAPKPSYRAYRAAVAQIGGRPPVRALGAEDGVVGAMRGYEFAPDASNPAHSGPLWAVWAWDLSTNAARCGTAPAPRDFTIAATRAGNVRRVLDMYGQPVQTRTGQGGSLLFALDARPVYVEWAR